MDKRHLERYMKDGTALFIHTRLIELFKECDDVIVLTRTDSGIWMTHIEHDKGYYSTSDTDELGNYGYRDLGELIDMHFWNTYKECCQFYKIDRA